MRPAASEEDDGEEIVESGGLLGGLNAWHFRMLCENPWEGGGGYTPREVGEMTLDQCWFRLCDKDLLASESGRKKSMLPEEVVPNEDGVVKGRAADGSAIQGRIRGKSVARQLMEEEEKKRREVKKKRGRKRRKRRGT